MKVVYLTVQSNYNYSMRNTTLQFVVYDNSDCGSETNPSVEVTTRQPIDITSFNSTISILVGCLAGMIAIVLIVAGFLIWKQKRNQRLLQKESNY